MDWRQISRNPGYLEYLEEARKKIYNLVVIFILVFILGFWATGPILGYVVKLMKIDGVSIVITSPFQFIDLAMNTGILIAVLFCLPLLIYQIYDFLKDSLKASEKRWFFLLLPIGFVLFMIGFAYGFVVLYYCLDVIAKVNDSLGIRNLWDINKFLTEIFLTSVLLGAIFEFPIVLSFMIKIGLLDCGFLKNKRKEAYIAIIIFVSLLPPTDGLSLIIMSVPLLLIYEMTVAVNSRARPQAIIINP